MISDVTPVLDVLKTIDEAAAPLSSEKVALRDALARFASESIAARSPAPAFSNSAMDGYAVYAADVANASDTAPVRLPLVGESRAGAPCDDALKPGHAIRVFTGAELPEGADAVVAQEDTVTQDGHVQIRFAAPSGHHIRRAGAYFERGAELVSRGGLIHPGVMGLLASQGVTSALVHRRPRVTLFATGDELFEPGAPLPRGGIYESNSLMLSALVTQAGGIARVLRAAGDDRDALVATLSDALRDDVVITTGGVSVGEYDFTKAAFENAGVDIALWKARIKPGKPLVFGTSSSSRGRSLAFGLPGNPVSAYVTFRVFVEPAIKRLLGDPAPFPAPIEFTLAHDHQRRAGRTELVRAHVDPETRRATLYRHQGSGNARSLAEHNALVVLPSETDRFSAGASVLGFLTSPIGVSAPWIP